VFVEIDDKPLGTASLAQVHRATLKDGAEVAVKIQHPHVREHAFIDMATMEVMAPSLTVFLG
jgi:predicted unusual protein kinase regulating ubiquinone biosynthesis (AarF/ABC1/UbiB family)